MFFDSLANDNGLLADKISIVGIGGFGNNALNHLMNTHQQALKGVEFCSVNSLEEGRERLADMSAKAELVILLAGMGGNTGGTVAPVLAEMAKKEYDAFTLAVVTKPFRFEGPRIALAQSQINDLADKADAVIELPLDNLLSTLPSKTTMAEAFQFANHLVTQAVLSVTDLLVSPGMIQVDLADIQAVIKGKTLMTFGEAAGENRAEQATKLAMKSPLLGGVDLKKAEGVIVSITTGADFELDELGTVMEITQEAVSPNASFKVATAINPEWQNRIRVSLLISGINE